MSEAHRILVHNCHLDGYGHVNNARYLEFLEQARWTYFRRAGVLDELGGARLVVAHIDIRYRHAAVLDDELLIASRLLEVQSRRLPFRVAFDAERSVSRSYLNTELYPTSVLIDKQGKVLKTYVGIPDFAALYREVDAELAK